MTDWNFVAVIVALLAILVALFAGGVVKSLRNLIWWAKLRNPRYSRCDTLFWNIVPNPTSSSPSALALHSCRLGCGDHKHKNGTRCWETTMRTTFNNPWYLSRRALATLKPAALIENELERSYLRTDFYFVMAFIFCTSSRKYHNMTVLERPPEYDYGGVRITVDRKLCQRPIMVLHLEGTFQRSLTKLEVERLIAGYPPFYRERLEVRPGGMILRPIQSEEDVARGGWVIAAGFTTFDPVPVYMDVRTHGTRKRAGVFWKSLARVQEILEGPITQAFPGDEDVGHILRGVDYMIRTETNSGGGSFLSESSISDVDISNLSQGQYATAVRAFNQPPRLSVEEVAKLKEELGPILGPTLKAAFLGVLNCFRYMKNAGRELDMMLPEGLNASSEIYLQGCE